MSVSPHTLICCQIETSQILLLDPPSGRSREKQQSAESLLHPEPGGKTTREKKVRKEASLHDSFEELTSLLQCCCPGLGGIQHRTED